ncbi:hypothetical protein [Marinoscillum sp.]
MKDERIASEQLVDEKPQKLDLIRLSTLTLLVLIFLSLLYVG